MPDRTGIFLGWSANLSNFLGLGVEAGASPMYPQKMRVPPLGLYTNLSFLKLNKISNIGCRISVFAYKIPYLSKKINTIAYLAY